MSGCFLSLETIDLKLKVQCNSNLKKLLVNKVKGKGLNNICYKTPIHQINSFARA